jgi:hypothetical protein
MPAGKVNQRMFTSFDGLTLTRRANSTGTIAPRSRALVGVWNRGEIRRTQVLAGTAPSRAYE